MSWSMLLVMCTIFPQERKTNGFFSPDKLRRVRARLAGAGSGGRFQRVPDGQNRCARKMVHVVKHGIRIHTYIIKYIIYIYIYMLLLLGILPKFFFGFQIQSK